MPYQGQKDRVLNDTKADMRTFRFSATLDRVTESEAVKLSLILYLALRVVCLNEFGTLILMRRLAG